MKGFRILLSGILILVFASGLTACGGNKAADAGITTTVIETTALPVPETEVQTAPSANVQSGEDSFIGEWKDVASEDGFVKVSKAESGLEYEDNDGKYKAVFADGVLKVQVSEDENDTAEAYINSGTGHLFLSYQGGLTEYERR